MSINNQPVSSDHYILTIGMPVFNAPEDIKKSVESVFNQTWQGKKQLLIIDDGSTDQTPAVINELQQKYQDIEVYRNEINRGRPFSRNKVLEQAKGKYLAWLDAGDIWYPKKLDLQFQALDNHFSDSKLLICTCPFRWCWIDRNTKDKVKVPAIKGDQLYNAIRGTLFPYLWTMLGPLDSFRSIGGFDEELPRRQDYDFTIRFLDAGGKIITPDTNEPLCIYLKTDVGRSGKEVTLSNSVIWKKHKSIYKKYGWRFAFNIRRRQFLLSARFFEANNNRFYRLQYALFERLLFILTGGLFIRSIGSFRKMLQKLIRAS